MADNITTVRTNLRVPGVPRRQAIRPLVGTSEGLRATSRAVLEEGRAGARQGRSLGQAGRELEAAALVFERSRQNEAINQAQNRAMEGLDELTRETSRQTDFSTSSQAFDDGAKKIRSDVERDLSSGREKRLFGERFESLRIVRKGRVEEVVFRRQRDQAIATLSSSLAKLSTEAAGASTAEERAAVAVIARDQIEAAAEDGHVTARQAELLSRKFASDATATAMRNLIVDDPKAALELLNDDEKSKDLDPSTRATLRQRAATQIRVRETRQRVQRNKARSELKTEVREMVAISKQGLPVAPALMESAKRKAREADDSASLKALERAEAVLQFQREATTMTPAELAARIASIETQAEETGGTADQAALVRAGRQILSRMTRELKRDPLTFANGAGIVDVPPVDVTGELDAGILQARKRQSNVVADHYNVNPRFFTASERSILTERFKTASAADKRALSSAMVAGFGAQAAQAFNEIGVGEPVIAYLGQLETLGPQHDRTVSDGFRGLEAIANKSVTLASAGRRRELLDAELGSALDSRLTSVRRRVQGAADAIYAARALDQSIEEFDEDLYRQAVRAAAGEHQLDGDPLGGIGEFNGHKMLLPQHLDEDGFADAIEALTDEDLLRMSWHGGRPMHRASRRSAVAASAGDFTDYWFVTVGPGLYQVSTTDPSLAASYLVNEASGLEGTIDETPQYYILDLTDPGGQPAAPQPPALEVGAP